MKILFLTILSLFTGTLIAQEINGIGVMQLGKTETQILKDLKIDSKDIVDGVSKTKKFLSKKLLNSVIKIKYDPTCELMKSAQKEYSGYGYDYAFHTLKQDFFVEKCNEAVVYLIPKYTIDNTTFNHFALTFYKDTLIRIFSENYQKDENGSFIGVFEAKYGSGIKKTTSKLDDCGQMSYFTTITWKTTIPDITIKRTDHTFCSTDPIYGTPSQSTFFSFIIQSDSLVKELEHCNNSGYLQN